MSMCRRFNGAPVVRLIVSVPAEMVAMVDSLLTGPHPARGCRAEFVRLALADRLTRDLMISGSPKGARQDDEVNQETPSGINDMHRAGGLKTISRNQQRASRTRGEFAA